MYNRYGKKEDQRELLTPEKIFSHQKQNVMEDIFLSVGALVFFILIWIAVGFEISTFHGGEEAEFSPWLVTLPTLLGGCFSSCFCIHQWVKTVSTALCVWGKKYRLQADTLERISEGEYDRLPFFSFKRFWGRGRGNRTYRTHQNTVTAYYFAKNGRATSRYISVHDGDFEGDTFYLVVREKDGVVMAAYNTKKYRLESEEI